MAIPLNADAVAALESTRGQHPRWCSTFSGQRIQQSSTAWDKAKERSGIDDFRFHDLKLMELSGWKSYEMVRRYAHLAPEILYSVARRLERRASRPSGAPPRGANVANGATFSLRSVD